MCTVCMISRTFDPARHTEEGQRVFAQRHEVTDASAGVWTNYSLGVGDQMIGTLDSNSDRDWFEVRLEAGEAYEITLRGESSFSGTLNDPYLYLRNAFGEVVKQDDDGGTGRDARITFQASHTGTYYLDVGSWEASSRGSYTLDVSPYSVPANGTLDQMADYLMMGYWGVAEPVAYDIAGGLRDSGANNNEITIDLSGLTSGGVQLARWAAEAWEMVANLSFREVGAGETAQIVFQDHESGAFANYNRVNYTLTSGTVNVELGWLQDYGTTIDAYSFSTYIHEIGHAIGLGHQGGYNGSANYPLDATFGNDSTQLTVMSYFDQDQNETVNASYANLLTPMMVDIVAIQTLYGASTLTDGDTIWGGAGSNTGTFLDTFFHGVANGSHDSSFYGGDPIAFTVFDGGGVDLVDLGFSSFDDVVDLRDTQFSDVLGLIGNVGIARGTVIENLTLGSGNNRATGNDARNQINAGAGNDTVFGNDGTDILSGGAGADLIYGGDHYDTISGGDGNDTVYGGHGRDAAYLNRGNDVFHDNTQGGEHGQDTIYAGYGNDTLQGGNGNDIYYGEWGSDLIFARLGNDVVYGGDQYDTIHAGDGRDSIWGGNGRDLVFLNQGDDIYHDNTQGGEHGQDTVYGGYGNDTIQGGNGDDLFGGEWGDDLIYARLGDDRLNGGDGSDTLYGGDGDDTLTGGGGDDRLIGEAGADQFVFASGGGNDVIVDFARGTDRLALDDGLWTGTYSTSELLVFANVTSSGVMFDFGDGQSVLLSGLTSTTGLEADLLIV